MYYIIVCYDLQIRIMVKDGGSPACSKTSVATISVQRNLNSPRFSRGEWTVEIMETQSLTEPIVTIDAQDADDRVCICSYKRKYYV